MRFGACQYDRASAVIHRVRLPRRRRPASYSAQFVSVNFILPMRWRREALCLKGIVANDQLLRLPTTYANAINDPRTNALHLNVRLRTDVIPASGTSKWSRSNLLITS